MLSKLKNNIPFNKKDKKRIDFASVTNKLSNNLLNVMEESFQERKSDTDNSNLTPSDVEKIIQHYSKKNMILAAASSIVPGPVLMTTWAKMNMSKISTSSINIFDVNNNYVEHFKKEETADITKAIQLEKIKGLANLIEANNEINETQIQLIGQIIENSDIPESKKQYYLDQSMKTGSNFTLNYQLLKDYEEDESLVMELAIMAKRSGRIDKLEMDYIYKVGHELNLEKQFIENLF